MQMVQQLQKTGEGCGVDILISYKPLSGKAESGQAMVLKQAKVPYKNNYKKKNKGKEKKLQWGTNVALSVAVSV